MAHELDITSGHVSFANSRSDAWHRLGQSVGHTMTAREALQAAHLTGWNVRKMPLQIPQPAITEDGPITPAPIEVPDHFATVRTNPITGAIDYLGVVGSAYEPVQNEESCQLLDALTDESGAHNETAGALRAGRETFVTMKLPQSMTFTGRDGSTDRTDWYLAALNSHDGYLRRNSVSWSLRCVSFARTPKTRRSGQPKPSFGISHTGGARAAIQEARTALKLSWRYIEAFEAEAAKLYAAAMDTEEVRRFAEKLVDVEGAESAARTRNRRERARGIVKLWTSSPTIAPIAGTRWAAYNAVTEYFDHVAPVRGARTTSEASATRAALSERRQHPNHQGRSLPNVANPLTPPADPVGGPTAHRIGPIATDRNTLT